MVLKEPDIPINERRGDAVNNKRTALSGTQVTPPSSKTIGWQPTCECEAPEGTGVFLEQSDHWCDREPYTPTPCTVLDPFAGSGTTLMVALRLGRSALGIELNPEYVKLAESRIDGDCPLFNRSDE